MHEQGLWLQCRADNGGEWLAQIRAIWSIQRRNRTARELCVYVRWYQPAASLLAWERRGAKPARYDGIWAQFVKRKVCMQRHPLQAERFVHSHFLLVLCVDCHGPLPDLVIGGSRHGSCVSPQKLQPRSWPGCRICRVA